MKRAGGLLLAAIVLAGCGSDEPTAAEKRMNERFDQVDYLMKDVEISQPPYVDNLERLTRRYLALIREYEDELGADEIKARLQEKSGELEPYCLPCVTLVDNERARY